jgi:hypothetical protein
MKTLSVPGPFCGWDAPALSVLTGEPRPPHQGERGQATPARAPTNRERTMKHVEIASKGIKFDSPYSDTDVAIEFRRLVENGDLDDNNFAQSLYDGARRFKRYTPNQIPWLHVLVAQHEGRPTRPEAAKQIEGLELIHTHLTNCRESRENGGKGLLHPTIGLEVGAQTVVLKLAGAKSRNCGKVSVASDHRYGHGEFYGWIDDLGNMDSRKPVPQVVVDILQRVAIDPARVISEIGRESGRCCYCFAALTTVASKIAGCGKTCGDNYGVEYPRAAEIRTFVLDHPEILEGASDADKWMVPTHA